MDNPDAIAVEEAIRANGFPIRVVDFSLPEDPGKPGDITNLNEDGTLNVYVIENESLDTARNGVAGLRNEYDLFMSAVSGWTPKIGSAVFIDDIEYSVESFKSDKNAIGIYSYDIILRT